MWHTADLPSYPMLPVRCKIDLRVVGINHTICPEQGAWMMTRRTYMHVYALLSPRSATNG
jgi:hypothetical protein